ncbi:MAG: glycoside hydrolase family 97 protein [Rikenellaceae bacterium]
MKNLHPKNVLRLLAGSLLLTAFAVLSISCSTSGNTTVTSPDGTLSLTFEIDESGAIFYNLSKGDRVVLNRSRLGFVLGDGDFSSGFTLKGIQRNIVSETWQPVWGEESEILDSHNEMRVSLSHSSDNSERYMDIVFRLFNDGLGFRYEFPEQENLGDFVIMDELTEFAMSDNHTSWSIPVEGIRFYEGAFTRQPLSEMGWVSTPVTFETRDSLFLTIHEANLTDYAAMNLLSDSTSTVLRASLTPWMSGEKVFVTDTRVSPWRTIIVAESAGDLLLSRLMLNLNEPCKIEDTSWITPMRYIGVWWSYHMGKQTWYIGDKHGATTENVMRHIDFAADNGFSGVLVEGWNEDWATWEFNFTKAYPDFDMKKITDYGREKGVALIGHHETGGNVSNYVAQMEDGFKLYEANGVHSVKTGYVGDLLDGKERHSSQYGVRHYRDVIETAAKYKISIDNHEPIIPTGLQRTYPNLMTQEGVQGQEWDAWDVGGGNTPAHTTIIPFTRGLAGPMDFTPVTFDFSDAVVPGTRVKTTISKQLALFLVLYSPLQMASDMIENYEANPEPLKFVSSCPVDWAQTVVLEAKIGEYLTMARKDKHSENWYVGGITNENERTATIDLSFLSEGATYLATIYRDTQESSYETNPTAIAIEQREVTSLDVLTIKEATSGGVAISLEQVTR